MTRKQKRKIALIVILLMLLGLLGAYYAYYRSTQKLSFDIAPAGTDVVQPPQFLYSFSGSDKLRMQRPMGVLADGEDVFVIDSIRHSVGVYNLNGDYKRSFGASDTVVPLYIAKNPTDGNLYITDRRTRSLREFTRAGKYLGEFNPHLPKDQLPKFKTGGIQWEPVAIAFGPDGTMYVTDILNGHRLLIFSPDGKFKKSVGTVGMVTDATLGEGFFQFPNGLAVHNGLVYVADSNNRRVQVFDKDGVYKQTVVTQGLPRGIAFLSKFPGDTEKTAARFVVVDTLGHDGTIWSDKGTKLINFGEQGILDGQFNYPNAVSVGERNKIFISDSANGRVQVWGWPSQASPVPIPRLPQNWIYCLLPLLLLPLLLLLRKKRFMATADFIEAVLAAGEADMLPGGRRKWFVTQQDYTRFEEVEQNGIKMAELLNVAEYSESDARALREKLEMDEYSSIVLSVAKRSRVFATEDPEMRRLAKLLEVDVVNRIEFIERFTNRTKGDQAEA